LFPTAAAGTVAGGKLLILTAKDLIWNAPQFLRNLKHLGLRGIPPALWNFFLEGWRTRFVFKGFAMDYTLVVAFEIGTRQYFFEDEEKFIFRDRNGELQVNGHSIYYLGSYLASGLLFTPIVTINNHIARYMLWRLAHTLTGGSAKL